MLSVRALRCVGARPRCARAWRRPAVAVPPESLLRQHTHIDMLGSRTRPGSCPHLWRLMPRHGITTSAQARKRRLHACEENERRARRSAPRLNAVAKRSSPTPCTLRHRLVTMRCAPCAVSSRHGTDAWCASSRHVCAEQGGMQPRTEHSSNRCATTPVPRLQSSGMAMRTRTRAVAARKTTRAQAP
jgi:hypothetical protein